MFGMNDFLRRSGSGANDVGFNAGYLGMDKVNPYPPNTRDHREWEHGYTEGIELASEEADVPLTYPYSNEYGDEEL